MIILFYRRVQFCNTKRFSWSKYTKLTWIAKFLFLIKFHKIIVNFARIFLEKKENIVFLFFTCGSCGHALNFRQVFATQRQRTAGEGAHLGSVWAWRPWTRSPWAAWRPPPRPAGWRGTLQSSATPPGPAYPSTPPAP